MTTFGTGTAITAQSLNTAFANLEAQIVSGAAAAGSLTGTTLASNVVNSSLTSVGTLASGSIPTTLLTGIVPTARVSGSYTGITGVGTLTVGAIPASLLTGTTLPATIVASSLTSVGTLSGLTSSSRIWAQTDLRVGNANSAVLSSDPYALIVTPQGYTGLPVRIGEHYNLASVGTQNSQFTVWAGPASGGEVIFKRAANITIASLQENGLYLSEGWLRTYGQRGWYSETYAGGIYMTDTTWVRTYNGKRFYSDGGYSGNVNYGNYGSMSVYGASGAWEGITFPDVATTWMSTANGQYFGVYRNNTTWNFYVVNGTFTPSDERYKRDIEPLQYGMNLIRGIVPITFDPLTEDPADDPEQTVGRTHYGFTTQNILQALANVGETRDVAIVDIGGPANESNESDRQYLNHSGLIAPMVKAIQELDLRLQQLETV
jgi:hypothetical protein